MLDTKARTNLHMCPLGNISTNNQNHRNLVKYSEKINIQVFPVSIFDSNVRTSLCNPLKYSGLHLATTPTSGNMKII